MKVKCINNNGWRNLTIGKTYDIIRKNEYGYYIIIDNDNDKMWYPKEYFKQLSEYRNEKIDKLLK